METRLVILFSLFASNAVFGETGELRIYQRNPDEFLWRLIIEKEAYTLLTVPMSGEVCSETGIVEKRDGKLRFVPTDVHDCPFFRILWESWFVIVERNGIEYLVEEDRIIDLDNELSHEFKFWFDYFERRKDIETEKTKGKPVDSANGLPLSR